MTDKVAFCEHCGARLAQDARFCEACGAQVQPVQNEPPVTAAQISPAPTAPFAVPPTPVVPSSQKNIPAVEQPKRKTTLWVLLGAGGCLSILCIGLMVFGAIFFVRSRPEITGYSDLLQSEQIEPVSPPDLPAPERSEQVFDLPSPEATARGEENDRSDEFSPEGAFGEWPVDIGQEMTDTLFSDDFSTDRFGWANVHEDTQSFGIEDGHYALHLWQADFVVWAYLPPEFVPTKIEFVAAVDHESDPGAFGVICHYQDPDNYHFVSIDPLNNEYSIGYLLDNEYKPLMRDLWMPAAYLADSPYAVNHIMISCEPDMITLFVNYELEAQAATGPQIGGQMAIYAETWDEISPNGFRVLFDNIFAFVPVQ